MTTAQVGDRVRIQYCRLPEHAATPGGTTHQKTIEFIVGSRKIFRPFEHGHRWHGAGRAGGISRFSRTRVTAQLMQLISASVSEANTCRHRVVRRQAPVVYAALASYRGE